MHPLPYTRRLNQRKGVKDGRHGVGPYRTWQGYDWRGLAWPSLEASSNPPIASPVGVLQSFPDPSFLFIASETSPRFMMMDALIERPTAPEVATGERQTVDESTRRRGRKAMREEHTLEKSKGKGFSQEPKQASLQSLPPFHLSLDQPSVSFHRTTDLAAHAQESSSIRPPFTLPFLAHHQLSCHSCHALE